MRTSVIYEQLSLAHGTAQNNFQWTWPIKKTGTEDAEN